MGLAGTTSFGLHLLIVNTREVAGGAMPRRKGFNESIKNNEEVYDVFRSRIYNLPNRDE